MMNIFFDIITFVVAETGAYINVLVGLFLFFFIRPSLYIILLICLMIWLVTAVTARLIAKFWPLRAEPSSR